jgi:hypothetical protein
MVMSSHTVATVMGHTYISMHTISCWIHHTNNMHHNYITMVVWLAEAMLPYSY